VHPPHPQASISLSSYPGLLFKVLSSSSCDHLPQTPVVQSSQVLKLPLNYIKHIFPAVKVAPLKYQACEKEAAASTSSSVGGVGWSRNTRAEREDSAWQSSVDSTDR
jgi:hypothetical protein